MTKRCVKSFHALCALRAPDAKVFTGFNDANQLACHCENHMDDDVKGTYRVVKDRYWENPYVGPEKEVDMSLMETVVGSQTPTSSSSEHTALSAPTTMMPFSDMSIFTAAPTPNKVGRPRKNAPPPSLVKPTLPSPPGMTSLPFGLGMVHPLQPPPTHASPSASSVLGKIGLVSSEYPLPS
jgi:hypothetical protein